MYAKALTAIEELLAIPIYIKVSQIGTQFVRGIFSRSPTASEYRNTNKNVFSALELLYVTFNFSGHPVIKVEKKFRRR